MHYSYGPGRERGRHERAWQTHSEVSNWPQFYFWTVQKESKGKFDTREWVCQTVSCLPLSPWAIGIMHGTRILTWRPIAYDWRNFATCRFRNPYNSRFPINWHIFRWDSRLLNRPHYTWENQIINYVEKKNKNQKNMKSRKWGRQLWTKFNLPHFMGNSDTLQRVRVEPDPDGYVHARKPASRRDS